jgi:hypothetical protein
MRVQSQRIFRMPRLERKETPGRPGDLLLINPMTELRAGPPAPRVFGVGTVHTISRAATVRERIPAFFGQRIPVPARISQVRQ